MSKNNSQGLTFYLIISLSNRSSPISYFFIFQNPLASTQLYKERAVSTVAHLMDHPLLKVRAEALSFLQKLSDSSATGNK